MANENVVTYVVTEPLSKIVRWDDYHKPTVAEIIEIAKKEFPKNSFEELVVTVTGWDSETIQLQQKE